MATSDIEKLRKKMADAFGHEVEIVIVGGFKKLVGKCINYTQPLDNEPEIASIDIRVPGYSSIYEITEEEIEELTIKD